MVTGVEIRGRSILKKLLASESKIDDFVSVTKGILVRSGKLFLSNKVQYKNSGRLEIEGRLFFGTFSNRNGLNPSAVGVCRIFPGGVFRTKGLVRIARDCKVYVAGEPSIANGTYINPSSMIYCGNSVSIGSGCAISWNCEIIDDDMHHIVYEGNKVRESSKPIVIGNQVWIGSGARILKGVIIGDNAIIAAGSIVTRDIPANCMAAGIPARVVRTNVSWE